MESRQKKEIVLTLTNRGALSSTTVNLFSFDPTLSTSGGSSSAIMQYVGINSGEFTGANWSIKWYPRGSIVSSSYTITAINSITDMINALNAVFTQNGVGIFWYESDPLFTYSLKVASSEYDFFELKKQFSPLKTFNDSTTTLISGTSVSVQTVTGVSYNSICTDLTTQPYILTSMYVRSASLAQISNPLTVSKLDANGTASTRPIQPVVDPNQSQSVQAAIPVYMRTSALNELQYTINASTTVQIIMGYENISLFDGLALIQSGEFVGEMESLRSQDQKEYNRVMTDVKGYSIGQESKPIIHLPKEYPQAKSTYAVPLIYSIARQNGKDNVWML
jgi:hypothetical protein